MQSMSSKVMTAAHRPQPDRFTSNGYEESAGIDFGDDQQPVIPKQFAAHASSLNRSRSIWQVLLAYVPNTKWTISLCAVLVAEGIICIALQSYAFTIWQASIEKFSGHFTHFDVTQVLPAQFATLAFESIYQVILALDAIRRRNIVQAIGVCVNNLCLLVVVAMGWAAVSEASTYFAGLGETAPGLEQHLHSVYIALFSALSISTVLLGLITWKLAGEFAWAIYRHISAADLQLRKRYLIYEIYVALLHLSFFFLFGLWVQTLVGIKDLSKATLALSIVALVLSIISTALAGYSASRESKIGIALAGIVFVIVLALAATGLERLWTLQSDYLQELLPMRTRLTAYAGLAMFFLVASIVMTVVVGRNFDRGLAPHLRKGWIPADRSTDFVSLSNMHGPVEYRSSEHSRSRLDIE